MKIGSHSGLLSRLINILSAKTGPVCEQEEPPHTCAGRKPEANAGAWPSGASVAAWGTPWPAEDGWVLPKACWGLSSLPGQPGREPPSLRGPRAETFMGMCSREEVFTDLVATCARHWASVKGIEINAPDPVVHVGH